MPKIPDDNSADAVKRRVELTAASKAQAAAKRAEPAPVVKPRIAKKR